MALTAEQQGEIEAARTAEGRLQVEMARSLYERFVEVLRARGLRVETGEFGAMMEVASVKAASASLASE